MKEELIWKLNGALRDELSEANVTYILVKVRELIDATIDSVDDSKQEDWRRLKAYCDWTVHITLTFNGRTKPFLEAIEKYIRAAVTSTFLSPNPLPERQEIEQLYYLEEFRQRLRGFLDFHQLPNYLTDSLDRWLAFLQAYGGIIHNRSMSYSGTELRLINQMTFSTFSPDKELTITDASGKSVAVPFGIHVKFGTRQGLEGTIELPGGRLLRPEEK